MEARDDFYLLRNQAEIPVRSREAVLSVTLRKPEMLPPDEIRKIVLHIVQAHLGAGTDEIVTVASRMLGFQTTGPKVREAIAGVVDRLVADGSLHERENRLYAS